MIRVYEAITKTLFKPSGECSPNISAVVVVCKNNARNSCPSRLNLPCLKWLSQAMQSKINMVPVMAYDTPMVSLIIRGSRPVATNNGSTRFLDVGDVLAVRNIRRC